MSELDKVRDDVKQLLTDIRGTIDEAIVQLDLGEKDIRDVVRPVTDRLQNGWADVRERLGL